MRLGVLVTLLAACGAPSANGDDVGDGDGGVDGDGSIKNNDPLWPDDVALPAEFDFPPYASLIDPTTVFVSWKTASEMGGRIRYGTTTAYGEEINASPAVMHHVMLPNLEAGTAYHYEVSITNTTAVRKGMFVMPGSPKFRFVHAGEFHAPSESSGVAKFADAIRSFRPHLVVESGDMVDDGNDMTHWRSYMRTSAPWISNVLILPAHSNHVNGSGGNGTLKAIFELPNNERWYTTRYGNVEVFTIDSTYDQNSDVMSAELPWLATAAAAAHDGTDDPTFVIAAWHYPACSSQYLTRASVRTWVQDNLVAAFKANGGVDLILAAHDKYYERSTITGGIVHVITNIGNISPEIPGGNHSACTAVKTLRNTRSAALITVDGNTLSAKVIDELGAEIDTFTIAK